MNNKNDITLKYKAKIAIRNYTLVLMLLVMVVIASKLLGNSTELMLLKLATVPLFFLSTSGLRSIYKHPIVEHKLTPRSVEYVILDGLLLVLLIFIVTWDPEATTAELLKIFFIQLIGLTLLKLIFLVIDVKKLANERND